MMLTLSRTLRHVISAGAILGATMTVNLPAFAAGPLSPGDQVILPTPGDGTGTVAQTNAFPDPFDVFLNNPTPNLLDGYFLDGIPVALRFDEFYTYSAPLLQSMVDQNVLPANFGPYDFSSGVGTIDITVFTQAGGIDNQNVGPDGNIDVEDPAPTTAGGTQYVEGYWGINDQNFDNTPENNDGPVTIQQMLDFLHQTNPANNIPVFGFDSNQEGGDDSLLSALQVQVVDSTDPCYDNNAATACVDPTAGVKADWSLDRIDNGVLDDTSNPDNLVLNYGDLRFRGTDADCNADPLCIDGYGVTDSGNDYPANPNNTLSHNTGSGQPDFFVFAPTMDLQKGISSGDWLPTDLMLVHYIIGCQTGTGIDGGTLGCANNGGEEGLILSAVTSSSEVPEPATLMIVGFGIALIGILRRRKTALVRA